MTEPREGSASEDEVVEPVQDETPEPAEAPAEPSAEQQLAERTLDLQRLQAEYVNYKRRVDRDRELVRAQGEAAVLQSLLTVLDDIARADEHGELTGGFKAVADALQQAVVKHKLESFGAKGDAFDPSLHEAVFHAGESADVEVTSIDTVMRTGYRHGDRVLRPATVGVVDPASPASPVEPVETSEAETPAEPVETDDEQ
ncbi:nucleotide exchange factor GrpE [Aeromicrobium fastidiosum]|uniref:Protein GrpE n=1 Tax=Aeromicrobium fastidiosum TaxID=52699 RepID=A0A641ARK6_9ACTN|nr:nucleotide exchange factor GrpE [Aeromicrobium fastidiosum]KAA1380147.1 nucleotide exchange factor GrpE [Aeromicrobium fastidiosum]MBP2389682.1 molecular chaperone GrpE [Aeromicrobium fastidiosum]